MHKLAFLTAALTFAAVAVPGHQLLAQQSGQSAQPGTQSSQKQPGKQSTTAPASKQPMAAQSPKTPRTATTERASRKVTTGRTRNMHAGKLRKGAYGYRAQSSARHVRLHRDRSYRRAGVYGGRAYGYRGRAYSARAYGYRRRAMVAPTAIEPAIAGETPRTARSNAAEARIIPASLCPRETGKSRVSPT
jgi:hypothetical protein